MQEIPRDDSLDSSPALLKEGYRFIANRCEQLGSDIFEARLMLEKAVCMRGPDAARFFYEGDRFTRRDAMPKTVLLLLQDKGSVQTLDGPPHHHRKQMFMDLMSPASIAQLTDIMAEEWERSLDEWQAMDEVVVFDALHPLLCRAVFRWAGVPLDESQVDQRAAELAAMYEHAGSIGPKLATTMVKRERHEHWAGEVIEKIRAGELTPPPGSAADVIAHHRDLEGEPLDLDVAVVELINILRPTVAVARFIGFAALALHEHPEARAQLEANQEGYTELFVQEVRRFYPFFPLIGGRARERFEWNGIGFDKDQWVLLDIYSTNRDPRTWREPERFIPERFREWEENAYNFIPQGGGNHYQGHRCPGEWITIALMKRALHLLTAVMAYQVPEQDLSIDLAKMPAVPESRFVISHVRRRAE